MSMTKEDIAYTVDLFSGLGEVTTRRMMGGLCLYHEGTIFAIVQSDMGLMIKGAGAFVDELEARGCTRWVYTRKDGGTAAMPYWTLPPDCEDDPEAASALAREALKYL
jgi:DNA transformation protein